MSILALVVACCALALAGWASWREYRLRKAHRALAERCMWTPEQVQTYTDQQRIEFARGHIEAARGAEMALEGHQDNPQAALMLASARMQAAHAKALIRAFSCLLAVILLGGCSGPLRQVNRGAPVPLFHGSPTALADELVRRGGERLQFPRIQMGWTDRERMECAVAWSPNPDARAGEWGALINEFCHLTDLVGGDHWYAAYLLTGGSLNALCDDMPADARAAANARAEARRRARAEGINP